jgi:hypothetical protein
MPDPLQESLTRTFRPANHVGRILAISTLLSNQSTDMLQTWSLGPYPVKSQHSST